MALVFFLPIADRELRVAARKPSTFWVRVGAALVALVIGTGCLILAAVGSLGIGTPSLGRALFGALTWLGLAATLSAGLFLTADCLSEEKREGTLGFLFLTDLRGYDVVLGKLLATSLRGFLALLGVFPILAITVLLGGVTGAQLAQTSLALVNALILSLAAGLLVSAISRESQKALAGALVLLVLLAAAGPAADEVLVALQVRGPNPWLSLTSPVYVFLSAELAGSSRFWTGLLINGAVVVGLFCAACLVLPRTWQERRVRAGTARQNWAYRWKYGSVRRLSKLRQRLLDLNPILWLACRERWQATLVWTLAILLVAAFATLSASESLSEGWVVWSPLAGMLSTLFYLGVTSQASRLFLDTRRSGLLELLLSSPLTPALIVQGQWRALLRMFGPPLALCLAITLLGDVFAQQMASAQMAGAVAATAGPPTAVVAATTNANVVTTSPQGSSRMTVATPSNAAELNLWVAVAITVAGRFTVAANLVALAWVGMWLGLTSRNVIQATLLTILFVQVVPWFVASFAAGLVIPLVLLPSLMKGGAAPTQMMLWFPLLISGIYSGLFVAKDIGCVLWARRRLLAQFRERAALTVAPRHSTLIPQPPSVPAPPFIAPS